MTKIKYYIQHFFHIAKNEGFIEGLRRLIQLIKKKYINIKGKIIFRFRKNQQKIITQIPFIEEHQIKIIQHTQSVDIIICIHNALEDTKLCLNSIIQFTSSPYNIILVDDGSDYETQHFLEAFSKEYNTHLLRSNNSTGYTYAANRGLKESSADFVILLNSDTIVTNNWVDRMIYCANRDERIGLVGPLSNTASWQSIPKIEENDDWASNPLPTGISVSEMGRIVEKYSSSLYPDMPLLNGFCLLIKRSVLDQIGLFDEENFGKGYGEEDDYVLRARRAGWNLCLADDVYIYHAQSKSYSSEKRKLLSAKSGNVLIKKHGKEVIEESVYYCLSDRVLNGLRAKSNYIVSREKILKKGEEEFGNKRVLFIVPIDKAYGGGNIIVNESKIMWKMGVYVSIFNLSGHKEKFEKYYPNLPFPVIYGEKELIPKIAEDYDAVIASTYNSVEWMDDVKKAKRAYYIQDFEPLMFSNNSKNYQIALETYTKFKELIYFTKSRWNQQIVLEKTGTNSQIVGVDFDVDLFLPRPNKKERWPNQPIQIAAMIRPETEYRQPSFTMSVLKKIWGKYRGMIEINIFGTSADNYLFQKMDIDFPWKLYGILAPQQVAYLLNQMDIFLDLSTYQAMGLTALEAMSCGCSVIAPKTGGANSFIVNGENGFLVDTNEESTIIEHIQLLIENHQERSKIQMQALSSAQKFYPEIVTYNILDRVLNEKVYYKND